MTSSRIVLKCDPAWTASPESARDAVAHGYMDERHDALVSHCYRQAIEEWWDMPANKLTHEQEMAVDAHVAYIEQRAADLLAEKLR